MGVTFHLWLVSVLVVLLFGFPGFCSGKQLKHWGNDQSNTKPSQNYKPCGRHKCLNETECSGKTFECTCPPGTVGKGHVQCADPDSTCLCTIWGDPHFINFREEGFILPFPCSHVIADLTTPPTRQIPKGCKLFISGRARYPDNGPEDSAISFENAIFVTLHTMNSMFTTIIDRSGFTETHLTRWTSSGGKSTGGQSTGGKSVEGGKSTGGKSVEGGKSTGGKSSKGGKSTEQSTGGKSGKGGKSTGGQSTGGKSVEGGKSTGGKSVEGGKSTGGKSSKGGKSTEQSTGGKSGKGGKSTGGQSTGGKSVEGGKSTGGKSSKGGKSTEQSTGGKSGKGGKSTGGQSTGGKGVEGGKSTGGKSVEGGKSTGGKSSKAGKSTEQSTGGKSGKGGKSTGGQSTGGKSVEGGKSTGGKSSKGGKSTEQSTGGKSGKGGKSTGGQSTGGKSVEGGKSTGGKSSKGGKSTEQSTGGKSGKGGKSTGGKQKKELKSRRKRDTKDWKSSGGKSVEGGKSTGGKSVEGGKSLDIEVQTDIDAAEFHRIIIPACGVSVKFRPTDGSFSLQTPIRTTDHKGMCGPCSNRWNPPTSPKSFKSHMAVLKLLLTSLQSSSPIDNTDINIYPSCTTLTKKVRACPVQKRENAVEFCGEMLINEDVRKCLFQKLGKKHVQDRFTTCYDAVCTGSATCSDFRQLFSDCGDEAHLEKYLNRPNFC